MNDISSEKKSVYPGTPKSYSSLKNKRQLNIQTNVWHHNDVRWNTVHNSPLLEKSYTERYRRKED